MKKLPFIIFYKNTNLKKFFLYFSKITHYAFNVLFNQINSLTCELIKNLKLKEYFIIQIKPI